MKDSVESKNKHVNSRATFNIGLSYNAIIDDDDNDPFNGEDDISDLLDERKMSLLSNNSYVTNNTSFDSSKSFTPIKKKKRLASKQMAAKNMCLNIDILPDFFRNTFSFQRFNRMQTEAFPVLYDGDDNCVVSAPTGSGKTVLFELAILHLINSFKDTIEEIKILYIAPIKSLCCERFKGWGPSFLNLSVGMLTGDTSYLETENIKKCNIIITTPEKLDLLTRKWKDYGNLFGHVKLVLVDEVHILREKRGATLEVVLTRMNTLCANIRIIAVSATIPNIEDVSEWLNSQAENKSTKVLSFDDTYRQIDLKKHVYGYSFPNQNEFQYDSLYNLRLSEILRKHSDQRSVLIFCPTRASTVSTAKFIIRNCPKLLTQQQCSSGCRIRDHNLFECFKEGVAYHHAGLSTDDRGAIEQAFLDGNVKILCSTSTLAMGVNLPAYLVVIKGTRMWASSMFQEYSQLDVLQMIGRAGRPQFESEGCAVIMTETKMSSVYEKMLHGTESLESSLHLDLIEHLAAEICLGTIYSLETAVSWLRNTFFYVRLKRNPYKYKEVIDLFRNGAKCDSQLSDFLLSSLDSLTRHGIIKQRKGNLTCTAYGYAMSRHCVLFETMLVFLTAEKSLDVEGVLRLLSSAKEFAEMKMRHKEKRLYRELNSSPFLRYPFLTRKKQKQIIDKTNQKISLLIQYELGGLEYPNTSGVYEMHQTMVHDKMLVLRYCFRLLKCFVDILVEKRDGISLKNTLFLIRSIYGSCWEDSGMALRQLKSIGPASVFKFISNGIRSIDDVRKLKNQQIECYLGLGIGNGAIIKEDAKLLPILHLECKLKSCSVSGTTVDCVFKLEVCAEFKSSIWHGRNLSIDFEAFKTSGSMLDFKRMNLAYLRAPTSFTVPVRMSSENDAVEFTINCSEVAGIGKTIFFGAKELPVESVKALSSKRRHVTLESCLFHPNSDELDASSMTSDDSLINYFSDEKSSKHPEISESNSPNPRKILANGNYECHHICKDKSRCQHLCCKEGISEKCLRDRYSSLQTKRIIPKTKLKRQYCDLISILPLQSHHVDQTGIKSFSLSSPNDVEKEQLRTIQIESSVHCAQKLEKCNPPAHYRSLMRPAINQDSSPPTSQTCRKRSVSLAAFSVTEDGATKWKEDHEPRFLDPDADSN